MTGNMQKYLAEFIGTLALILIGCGAVAIGGFGTAFPVGILPVALAFGLTVTAMAYTVGPISGAHLNPAVTVSLWVAGRIKTEDLAGYIIAQCLGGIVGAGLLVVILKGKLAGYDIAASGLGQNGWGAGYLGGYGLASAVITEFVATFLFTFVILAATSGKGATPFPGLIIGLTLAALHFPFINVTGLSVNPARSLGPAVFVGGQALAQVWLFLIVPVLGGAAAGWLERSKTLDV
ncbi:MAG: aquaporin [Alphaproteobacteria bacterium]|nr:aquaporin [Alphaproteobacteria bacterium]